MSAQLSEVGQLADVQIGGELTGEMGSRRRLVRQRMQADHEAACSGEPPRVEK
ncbi:hypothetical protein GA0061098_101668 [Bradyrhizobium shewense]|uniref:Uncharacterized protein n=1 Tax=Bradyrhizobium shewense TaxID=1761772 RepID=A0A1C3XHY5_9BRAD|nr:hypothetical protein [Bradyrhizobium shewense]SCB51809.1 hypothetical protein GA0061098_101668 [Bradyrhizobium shewense]